MGALGVVDLRDRDRELDRELLRFFLVDARRLRARELFFREELCLFADLGVAALRRRDWRFALFRRAERLVDAVRLRGDLGTEALRRERLRLLCERLREVDRDLEDLERALRRRDLLGDFGAAARRFRARRFLREERRFFEAEDREGEGALGVIALRRRDRRLALLRLAERLVDAERLRGAFGTEALRLCR